MPDRQRSQQTVLITRPVGQAESFANLLKNAGFNPIMQPVVEIRAPADWSDVDDAIGRLDEFGWFVFASVNGVRYFLKRLSRSFRGKLDLPEPPFKIAAIGSRTAAELELQGWKVDLQPEQFDSRGMADALIKQVDRKKVLLVRASRGSQEIPQRLQAAEIAYRQIEVYQSVDVATVDPAIVTAMQCGEIDWVTITSSAIARCVVNLFGESLRQTKLVSISPATSGVLVALGFPPAAEAFKFTMPGVVQAITSYADSD